MKHRPAILFALFVIVGALFAAAVPAEVAIFESGPVRPLAMSADGSRLFAANAPDNRLEILAIDAGGELSPAGSVPVGLEPVAVAARNDDEVWVVNHLSDSVSIIDVAAQPPRVVRTLLVGDEPRDIVFAGPGRNRAFITAAHRGQNNSDPPQLTTPGIGRADVWVFDADAPGETLGGTPLTIVTLFGDTPRALAVSSDGATVYAAVFHSGNQTTVVTEEAVCNGGADAEPCLIEGVMNPGGLPAPNASIPEGIAGPEVALIVKFNPAAGEWQDELGRNWNNAVRFTLPDKDVFAIDATATPPVQAASFAGVGTILFNMVANPATGKVYVSNTEAPNEVRFEGPGGGGSTVQGHLHEARITVLDGSDVHPRHLNKHIDYAVRPAPPEVKDKSLATPLEMVVSADGSTLYVAALGSDKIGVFDTAELEENSFVPDASDHISVSGGGPTGVVLDESRERLYVLTRFDNGIAVIDTSSRTEVGHLLLHNPEPPEVVNGRRFLYDAHLTSSNGEASCAGCHVFGDLDSLAWDLGNPDDTVLPNRNPFRTAEGDTSFHPMKGPMTTQTLRGMANHGPMHWRGDRSGGNDPGGNPVDEEAAFKRFNVAFAGLLGRTGPLSDSDMQAFTDFMLQVVPPPNPIRNLNNSLTADQLVGKATFDANCGFCHVVDRRRGFIGTDGVSSFEGESQHFKIPSPRNLYQKIGMFGLPKLQFIGRNQDGTHMGDQIRGFGFLHDGSIDTVFHFLTSVLFIFPNGDPQRRQTEDFLLAFDSNFFPIVGQQVTLAGDSPASVGARISLLLQRAQANECEVVVKGNVGGEQRGWHRLVTGTFQSDRVGEAPLSDTALRLLAGAVGQELTYTAVPPGSGERIGVDRDADGIFDRDEIDAGTDPADPLSPGDGTTPTPTLTATASLTATPTPTTTPTVTPTPLCGAGPVIEPVRVRIDHNLDPAGDERLHARGRLTTGGSSPAVDPATQGMQLLLLDGDGSTVWARTVPPGLVSEASPAGWRVNLSGTAWRFKDPAGILAGGITSALLVQSRRDPQRFRFVMRGSGSFQVERTAPPLRLVVVLDGDSNSPCASAAFGTEAARPGCLIRLAGDMVVCR